MKVNKINISMKAVSESAMGFALRPRYTFKFTNLTQFF